MKPEEVKAEVIQKKRANNLKKKNSWHFLKKIETDMFGKMD